MVNVSELWMCKPNADQPLSDFIEWKLQCAHLMRVFDCFWIGVSITNQIIAFQCPCHQFKFQIRSAECCCVEWWEPLEKIIRCVYICMAYSFDIFGPTQSPLLLLLLYCHFKMFSLRSFQEWLLFCMRLT